MWNPVTGCTKVSPGCAHCYAECLAARLRRMGAAKYARRFEVALHRDALDDPLRAAPAAVKSLLLEPLLGPLPSLDLAGIDWVIAGGESGPGARPMQPDWVRGIRDRCARDGVPFFFKQWGGTQRRHAEPAPSRARRRGRGESSQGDLRARKYLAKRRNSARSRAHRAGERFEIRCRPVRFEASGIDFVQTCEPFQLRRRRRSPAPFDPAQRSARHTQARGNSSPRESEIPAHRSELATQVGALPRARHAHANRSLPPRRARVAAGAERADGNAS